MKKLVIFDLDGTLVDSVKSIAYCGNYALNKMGYQQLPISQYKLLAGDGVDNLLKRMLKLSGDQDASNFQQIKMFYKEVFEEGCLYQVKPYDKIQELLQELKQNNVKIAVFSNKLHYNTCKVVKNIFGDKLFDYILGYKEENKRKPDPMGALLIAKHLQVDPKQCIYVGDTNTDMKTGISAGMFTIGVDWGFRTVEELKEYGAMKIISDPLEILTLI